MNKRFIFVNRYFYPDESATSQMLTDLAFYLAERDYEVVVITGRQLIDNPRAELLPVERTHDVLIYRLWTSRWGRNNLVGRAADYLTFYLSAAIQLIRIARKGVVIIAKTDPPLIGVAVAIIGRVKRASVVNWWQDIYPEIAEQLGVAGIGLVARPLASLRNWTCRAAISNVVIGRCMRDRLTRAGLSPDRITVIPNWADDVVIRPMIAEENPLREEWGLSQSFVVGYSGNLGRGHDFNVLLDAASMLADEPAIRFLFIGSGAGRAAVVDRVRELGLTNVMFKPFQPRSQLGVTLTVPDIHIVSLKPELSGLIVPSKFYGALAAGRGIIFLGPENSEIARVIRDCNCGFVYEDSSAVDIARTIQQLRSDCDLRDKLGRNARLAVDNRYNKAVSLEAWQATLDSAER